MRDSIAFTIGESTDEATTAFTQTVMSGETAGAATSQLNAVVIYEDAKSRMRVKQFWEHLAKLLGGGVRLRSSWWKFEALELAGHRELAALDAAEADLIMVSANAASNLPQIGTAMDDDVAAQERPQPHGVGGRP